MWIIEWLSLIPARYLASPRSHVLGTHLYCQYCMEGDRGQTSPLSLWTYSPVAIQLLLYTPLLLWIGLCLLPMHWYAFLSCTTHTPFSSMMKIYGDSAFNPLTSLVCWLSCLSYTVSVPICVMGTALAVPPYLIQISTPLLSTVFATQIGIIYIIGGKHRGILYTSYYTTTVWVLPVTVGPMQYSLLLFSCLSHSLPLFMQRTGK